MKRHPTENHTSLPWKMNRAALGSSISCCTVLETSKDRYRNCCSTIEKQRKTSFFFLMHVFGQIHQHSEHLKFILAI